MRKHLQLFALVCLFSSTLLAQVVIKGKVKDKKTGDALIGASVSIKGNPMGVTTDFDGEFSLSSNEPLPLTLLISYIGYSSVVHQVTSTTKSLVIHLSEATNEFKTVEIRDSRITEKQKQAPLTIETLDAIAIKETPAANFYEGLAHLKGVDLTSASIGFKIINTRGFNSTSPVRSLQLIDGVDNQSPGLNFSLGNFLGASELDIQRVDLVVGASGAYYGPNAFNGVINMQTKNPFLFPGLSVSMKGGERGLFECAIRWAQVFKNKKGEDKFAYKINAFYMRAYDWEATNYSATSQSPSNTKNPGGYDAVNRYGDEFSSPYFYTQPSSTAFIGRGYYLREGYQEKDLVDYNTNNTKLSGSFHYKITKNIEAIYASNFSTGTTVYQGDNRFSLKDIKFYQNRVEIRREDKFFIRAYITNEDAGKTYDAYNTAIIMQNNAKSDEAWGKDYNNGLSNGLGAYVLNWYSRNANEGLNLNSIPGANNQRLNFMQNYWQTTLYDSLIYFHELARLKASGMPSTTINNYARFVPGTYQFDTSFQNTKSKYNTDGGSRLYDHSALYHIAGEYKFKVEKFDITTGGNYRLFAPDSRGTIFSDTGNVVIRNHEVGGYLGVERKVLNDKLKISVTNRLDKNQNFNLLWSPAATFVYVQKQHVFRFSVSSAIRNPTLSDQYIFLHVGRATLKGNLNGFDSLVTVSSFYDALDGGRSKLQYFNVAPIKPEQVKTIELGYRGSLLNNKLYYDINWYYSWYTNFIGYKIGMDLTWPPGSPIFTDLRNIYRVAANAVDQVTTTGLTVGLNYFYRKYLGFSANYSMNQLDRHGSTDPLIPAFNTPKNKYNLGVNGRDIALRSFGNHWGYSVNYKYQQGFNFEGSPQFTGYVAAYGIVDAQVNRLFPAAHCTVKVGASNLLNNMVYQVYGGPQIGRLAYISFLVELDSWR